MSDYEDYMEHRMDEIMDTIGSPTIWEALEKAKDNLNADVKMNRIGLRMQRINCLPNNLGGSSFKDYEYGEIGRAFEEIVKDILRDSFMSDWKTDGHKWLERKQENEDAAKAHNCTPEDF